MLMDKQWECEISNYGEALDALGRLPSVIHDSSVQFSSVAQSCPTLFNPMDCSTPGFPVLHYFPEFAQTRVHWVDDAM